MSYNPTGKRFEIEGVKYIFGVAEDDDGSRICAIFSNSGGQWMAMVPALAVDVQSSDVMASGSVAKYLEALLPRAQAQLATMLIPVKPSIDDKAMCLAYDCALDLDFDSVSMAFTLNKTPPLSHAR
jgi:hypothetical protein